MVLVFQRPFVTFIRVVLERWVATSRMWDRKTGCGRLSRKIHRVTHFNVEE